MQDGDGRIDYDEFCSMMVAGNEQILKSTSTLRRGGDRHGDKVTSVTSM